MNAFKGNPYQPYQVNNPTTLTLNPCTISNGSTRSTGSSASAITPSFVHHHPNMHDFHTDNNSKIQIIESQSQNMYCNTANCNQLSCNLT